jgi:7-carboxy-7-deazaguanine synthase
MIISEVFTSLQGEGILAGVPAAYACLTDGPPRVTWCEEPRERWTPDASAMLGTILVNIRRRFTSYVVICGAEALQVDDLDRMCTALRPLQLHVTIETSGAVFRELECDLMSVNVRLRNPSVDRDKAEHVALEYDVDALKQLVNRYNYQLKFEVADRAEMEEIRNLVVETEADRDKVVLQPLAGSAKDIKERMAWIMEASRFFGYRMVPRLPMPPAPPRPKKTRQQREIPSPFPFPTSFQK